MSDSYRPHGLQTTRLLCPWDFPGKSTGVGCHCVLHKEGWALNNWCFWTVVLEKTLESPFDCKEIQPVHPKGNQSWIFIGKIDVEAETPIFRPPDAKNWLIWKDPDPGKDWRQEEKEITLSDSWMASLTQWMWVWTNSEIVKDRRALACCSPWGHKESDTTEQLNNNIVKNSNEGYGADLTMGTWHIQPAMKVYVWESQGFLENL